MDNMISPAEHQQEQHHQVQHQQPDQEQRQHQEGEQASPQVVDESDVHPLQRTSQAPAARNGFDMSAPTDFSDDDPIEGAAPAATPAQPDADQDEVSRAGVLSLSTRVEYVALARGQTQEMFGLVTVHASEVSSQVVNHEDARQPMDIVCVLDTSSSMGGRKLRQVQDAVRFIIEQAGPTDRISIVTFDSCAAGVLKLRLMSSEGKSDAIAATSGLTVKVGTSIASGLDVAITVMEDRRQRNKISTILLLTDGEDNCSRTRIPSLVQRAAQANCSIYAFGFGHRHDAALLFHISELAHTPFTYVENTDRIREAFAGAIGGLTTVVAQNIELRLSGHVPLKYVHTGFAVTRLSDTESIVYVPDVFAGERKDVLVELAVPAGAAGDMQLVLLEASARYLDLNKNRIVNTLGVVMQTACTDEPNPEMDPDEEVIAQRERIEVTRALQEAASCGDRGEFDEARRVLDSAAERMKAFSNSRKKQAATTSALLQEVADARKKMKNRQVWDQGGSAEVRDATLTHTMQRCTNTMGEKTSKGLYIKPSQDQWVRKASHTV